MSGVSPKELLTRLSPLIEPTTDLGGTPVPQDYVIKGGAGGAWVIGPAPAPVIPSYTIAALPAGPTGALALVTDDAGGAVIGYYDGTNWRRSTDKSIIV